MSPVSLFLVHTAIAPANAQVAGAVAEMPSVVPLLLLGEGVIGKLKKRNSQAEKDSCCCWHRLLGWLPQFR